MMMMVMVFVVVVVVVEHQSGYSAVDTIIDKHIVLKMVDEIDVSNWIQSMLWLRSIDDIDHQL